MNLSPHFTYEEMTRNKGNLQNHPGRAELINLVYLCDKVLEPLRELWGGPIGVNSGYRNDVVNTAAGGTEKSQHRFGEAADVDPPIPAEEAMEMLNDSDIDFDQAIVYASGFIHISYKAFGHNRNQMLRSAASGGHGGPYTTWKPA